MSAECPSCSEHVVDCACKHDRWISLKDNLPQKDKWVLVATDTHIGIAQHDGNSFWENRIDGSLIVYHYGGWYQWSYFDKDITHWMPLPEVPNE